MLHWLYSKRCGHYKDVASGEYTISESATLNKVPRKTLSGKMNYKHANPNGRPTLLTPDEEKNLINYIHYMAQHAFPLTIQQIKDLHDKLLPVAEQHSLKIQAPKRNGGEVLKNATAKKLLYISQII